MGDDQFMKELIGFHLFIYRDSRKAQAVVHTQAWQQNQQYCLYYDKSSVHENRQ